MKKFLSILLAVMLLFIGNALMIKSEALTFTSLGISRNASQAGHRHCLRIVDYGSSFHRWECRYCNYCELESHSISYRNGRYECGTCGYVKTEYPSAPTSNAYRTLMLFN